MDIYQEITRDARLLKPELTALRRDLHRFPEQGWMEMRTSALIADSLRQLGYEVITGKAVCDEEKRWSVPDQQRLSQHLQNLQEYAPDFNEDIQSEYGSGHTGVIGILRCGEGPVVAMRFDIDALPITESASVEHLPARESFSSELPGSMHACGHDGHMAIGLGTARLLAKYKNHLHGTVKLIFQPAEEGVRGAESIVSAGHLGDADYLLGAHIKASEDGSCYAAPGMEGTLATTKLNVRFTGKSAHAAMAPQEGCNALLAAANAVVSLHAIPRHGEGSSRINVGSFHAGNAVNVICDEAIFSLEVRGETAAVNLYMEDSARRILNASAAMYGCQVSVTKAGAALTVANSPDLTGRIKKICSDKLQIRVCPSPGLGASEDFSMMTDHVLKMGGQTCYIGLHVPVSAPLHNPSFDFDEEALVLGTTVFAGTAADLLS